MAAKPTPRTTAYKGRFQAGATWSQVRAEKVDERKMRISCLLHSEMFFFPHNRFLFYHLFRLSNCIWKCFFFPHNKFLFYHLFRLLIIHLRNNCYSAETSELSGIGYCLLHSASISTLINLRPHRSAKARQSSRLAIVPEASSLTNSHRTPARGWPVRKHKSTALSVCPLRERTPPSLARRGTICPGRVKSDGCAEGEARARTVKLRSCAEIPVVVPWIKYKNKNKIR